MGRGSSKTEENAYKLPLSSRSAELEAELDALDAKVADAFAACQQRMEKKFGQPLLGRNRAVFLDPGNQVVYKVPRNMEGDSDNYYEAAHKDPGLPLADCKIIEDQDLGILRMELVTPVLGDQKELPDWVGFVDGAQVGYTREGRLVAYDL